MLRASIVLSVLSVASCIASAPPPAPAYGVGYSTPNAQAQYQTTPYQSTPYEQLSADPEGAQPGYPQGYSTGYPPGYPEGTEATAGYQQPQYVQQQYPQQECKSAYGTTVCGYSCVAAYGEVKCASTPSGT